VLDNDNTLTNGVLAKTATRQNGEWLKRRQLVKTANSIGQNGEIIGQNGEFNWSKRQIQLVKTATVY
jgi:hypothetical protein